MDKRKKDAYTVGSLFSGIGGIDLGFQNAGFSVSWANEIDPKACETYQKNFPHTIFCEDIKKLDIDRLKPVDVLTAGFPCQAFSIAGYRKGFEDARGSLFFEVIRIVKQLFPQIVFLENVKNLQSHRGGKTFKQIVKALTEQGYHVKSKVLNTCEYSNLPQNRERIYIMGFKDVTHHDTFKFPRKTTRSLSIQDLIYHEVDREFYYHNTNFYPVLKENMQNKNTCYQWRRKYIRENKSNLCPTLTANMGTGGHNVPLVLDDCGIRKLTPRECARFQGFPEDFILPETLSKSTLYKQLGNSVTVPVIASIAKNIKRSLSHD